MRGTPVGFLADHPLSQQVHKWFTVWDQAQIPDHLGEEPGIQQMKDGVFNTPDVLVDGHPVGYLRLIHGPVPGVRIAKPEKVPG